MPTVFVVQEQRNMSYAPALQHGNIKMVLRYAQRAGGIPNARHIQTIHRELAKYTTDDWIIPTGNPLLIGEAYATAGEQTGGLINVLIWDRQAGCYLPMEVDRRRETVSCDLFE